MVQIITDSTCDLGGERLRELGVQCVPLTVHFGEETYIDGVNLTADEFYSHLRSHKEIPTTAQPAPHSFEEAFQCVLERGDDVLCILVGSKLSGTVQSANIAKAALDSDKIWIVDTHSVCSGLGILVEIAAQRVQAGLSAAEIYQEISALAPRSKIYAAIETLEYVKKGGRLSGAAAMVGTMLNLHPIVTTKDGLVINVAKARGRKKLLQKMRELAMQDGIDETYPLLFCQGAAEENMVLLKECFAEKMDITNAMEGCVGPVVGTYSGPGVVAVGFIAKK